MKKFKIHIVREARTATEDSKEIVADEKDIIVNALSCCEAIAIANRQHPDYLTTRWEEIIEEVAGEKPKHVKLDRASFKTEAEWISAQMDMNNMDYNEAMKLIELRGWKIVKENN